MPLLSRTSEEAVSVLRRELLDLETRLQDTAADEADLADAVSELEAAVADTKADEADIAALADELRGRAAAAEADEADLAAQLRSLRSSQARFELYEDTGGDYRWRLRHRNGNIMADGGEGYASKYGAEDAVDSFKLNAPGAETAEAGADEE